MNGKSPHKRPQTVVCATVVCLLIMACGRQSDPARAADGGAAQPAALYAMTSADVRARVATSATAHTSVLPATVTTEVSQFDQALDTLNQVRQGSTLDAHAVAASLRHLTPDTIAELAHTLVLQHPDGLVAAIHLCTNALADQPDKAAFNTLCFYTGMAYERLAKNSSDPDVRAHHYQQAIAFYTLVLERAEQNIATHNAANAAFYLAALYERMGAYAAAETYYQRFAEYSLRFDHQPENAVFAWHQLAQMLCDRDPDRAERLCQELLRTNPRTQHRDSIERTLHVLVPQARQRQLPPSSPSAQGVSP